MSETLRITNARVLTDTGFIDGGVLVAGSTIAEIAPGASAAGDIDFAGDFLLPGLVEVHTDNLEKQFRPRPNVAWPADAALIAHDAQIAASGITTVCDAVCVGYYGQKSERLELFQASLDAVHQGRAAGSLRAEHLLHLRCEVSDAHVIEMFEPLCDEPTLALVSFMDHTPGQRQWRDVSKFREFHKHDAIGKDDDAFAQALVDRQLAHARYAERHRQEILRLLRGRELPLASHDDTTVDHVEQAIKDGMTVSEFPTTLEAAGAAREAGMAIVMGAPNVILGGSHSGNVSAIELAENGLLDVMSSDYMPVSLLHAAFRLADRGAMALPAALATVTRNAAAMLNLNDRGRIAPGQRADLIRVRRASDAPGVLAVWRQGQRVA